MSSIQYLTVKDFSLQDGKKGKLLCNNLRGFSFVMFYSRQCPHCEQVFPIFKELSRQMNMCAFAMINVSDNPGVVYASHKTVSPIKDVPYLILYINGHPFVKYTGARTMEEIYGFLVEMLKRVQSSTKKNFMETKFDVEDEEIPAWSTGIPFNVVCDKDGENCYLSFNEAYPAPVRR